MQVALTLAGAMELRRGETRVADAAFAGRQLRLVTAMLLLERDAPVPVDRVAEEVWPTGPPPTWRSALRTLVSRLRRLLIGVGLPDDVVVNRAGRFLVDLPELQVDIEEAVVDARQAARHLRAGEVDAAREVGRRALAVLALPVLPGLDAAWVDRVRDRLRDQHVDVVLVLSEAERRHGRWSASRRNAIRALDLAPLREAAWRALMRAEAGAGNTGAALSTYDQCRGRLGRDLGTDPDARTQRLHASILRNAPASSAVPVTTSRPGLDSAHGDAGAGRGGLGDASSDTALVGRDRLLHDVVGLLDDGASLLARGPAGIGKTRLVFEALTTATLSSRLVDRLLASNGTSGMHLATLAPIATGAPMDRGSLADVYGWFLRRWRHRVDRRGPALVWLDDAQHADELSAAILRHAVTVGAIQLVLTQRLPEPLGDDLQALTTEGLLRPVDVGPLSDVDAARLARQSAAAELPPAEFDRLVALAAGNPLYVRELAGSVSPGDRVLRLDTTEDLVARPLRHLADSRRRTAELIALAEPVRADLFAPRVDDLGVLLRRGLIRRHGERELRIDHPLRSAWLVHCLGPLPTDAYRDLLHLADVTGVATHLDPVTRLDWELQAGMRPDAGRAEKATRLAISRSDGPTASRLVEAVRGPPRDLLRGQARGPVGRTRRRTDPARTGATGRRNRTTRRGRIVVGPLRRCHAGRLRPRPPPAVGHRRRLPGPTPPSTVAGGAPVAVDLRADDLRGVRGPPLGRRCRSVRPVRARSPRGRPLHPVPVGLALGLRGHLGSHPPGRVGTRRRPGGAHPITSGRVRVLAPGGTPGSRLHRGGGAPARGTRPRRPGVPDTARGDGRVRRRTPRPAGRRDLDG